jgi:hypothetical protein
VTPDGILPVITPTKNLPPLVGFKTLEGNTWEDRYYVMIRAPGETLPEVPKTAHNKKPRPKIFKFGGK